MERESIKKICLVGNAPLLVDQSSEIDSANFVVRFNDPKSWGNNGGVSFDAWVIANGGGGIKFVKNQTFSNAPYKNLPGEIWFSRNMTVNKFLAGEFGELFTKPPGFEDLSSEIVSANGLTQRARYIPEDCYRSSLTNLFGEPLSWRKLKVPSAGFLALTYVLNEFDVEQVVLAGFTFQGWIGHPWGKEKSFVNGLIAEGKVRLI